MTTTSAARYGTRWGRTCLMAGVGLAVLGGGASMMWTNVLAVNANLQIQGSAMGFSASEVDAVQAGFGVVPITTYPGGTATTKDVLRAGFATATIDGLCISKVESLPLVGTYVVTLTSSDGTLGVSPSSDLRAANTTLDLSSITGGTQSGQAGNGINLAGTDQIGLTSADVTTTYANGSSLPYSDNPLGAPTDTGVSTDPNYGHVNSQGWTGIAGTSAKLYSIYGQLWDAQISGNIVLPNLKISVSAGSGGTGATSKDCAIAGAAGGFQK